MLRTTLVNATDLNLWAQRLDARHQLPRLLRRLVHATLPRVQDLRRIEFTADESVQLSGWDGIVQVEIGNAWVPDGVSGWEMGVTADIKGKADDDYEKWPKNSLGLNRAETTFVFVTLRRWANKEEWIHGEARHQQHRDRGGHPATKFLRVCFGSQETRLTSKTHSKPSPER